MGSVASIGDAKLCEGKRERSILINPDEIVDVVASGLCFKKNFVAVNGREFGSARENPEVIAGATANESIGVVGSEEEDAIVGVEGAKEGYAKKARSRGGLGLSLSRVSFSIFHTAIEDFDFAFFLQSVLCGAVG